MDTPDHHSAVGRADGSESWIAAAVLVMVAFALLVIMVINSVGPSSSLGSLAGPTGSATSTRAAAFIDAVAMDTRVSKVDYSQVPVRDLIAAGEGVCSELASFDGTPDGLFLERVAYTIRNRFALDRAQIKAGFTSSDPAASRNADLRVAFAVADAAHRHLCPQQPFDPSR